MRGASEATYSPSIGLICSPYSPDNPTQESSIMAFWIVPPPENRIMEYGRPMLMTYSVTQDNELSEQIIEEMKACVAYYKKYKFDMVDFEANFNDDTTYIEKLKVTLYSKFPRKQNDHEFWNFVREELGMEPESEFTPPRWAPSPHGNEPESKEITDESGQDLTSKGDSKQSKEDKLLIRSLQEQLSLPSGLNMNPSPISSTLLPNVTNSMSSNNSIQTSSSSPRDSPITIPSNSASPAKFEVPVRASPSPVKSDTSSTRTRNSPAPSPNKYSVDRTDLTRSSPSANLHKYEQTTLPSTSTPSTQPSLSDFYSANFSTLAKNLSNYSPSDYAMLFNSKDYGLSSLNQLAASSAMTNTSSSSSNKQQQQQQQSQSSSAAAVATATANNMKDFLAQLEKTTELSYLMQSQYNYPGLSATNKSANEYHSSPKSSTKHEKSKSSRASSAQQQHQRQMEEDYKRDANNISEFMRSQEYASLLMEQAEALSKSYQLPEMPKKSKKSQQQQHQQQHGPSAADLTSLLQASPKIHELNSLLCGKQSSDLTSLLQQQLSAASPSTSSSQKKNQNQQPDYSSLFAHSKMADLTSLMATGQSERDRHMTPSAAELSALFGSALGGKSSVDMLSLLQSSKASDLSSLLFSQANAAELSNLFSQAVSSSSAKSAANTAAYYTQAAIDKAQQDMASLYQQHGKYSSIPDPLSKSTLAANNMFMNPSAVYAKMQQEALNAMIMKPPKVSSSSSTTSSSKSREASASPALDKSHKSRDSPASLNKYNFSAADLAISAVSNVPNAMSSPSTDHARKLNEFSQMDISLSEASQLESRLKKRMENFSSIADLVSTPSKMQKLEELANMHMQESESDSTALNLSSND